MKLRKIKGVLLTIGVGAFVLGAVLFFVIPLIAGKGFEYTGLDAFVAGVNGLLKFDFGDAIYSLVMVLTIATIICLLWYLIIICIHKKGKHAISMVGILVVFILIQVFLSTYLLADVNFNGEDCKLLKTITEMDEFALPKVLSMLVLCLFYLSIMFMTLYVFIDLSTMVIGEKKEVVVTHSPDEGLEDRKAREERLFAELIATGDYSEYDEIDLGEPLEGYTEEPVFEATEIEEFAADHVIKDAKKNEEIIVVK